MRIPLGAAAPRKIISKIPYKSPFIGGYGMAMLKSLQNRPLCNTLVTLPARFLLDKARLFLHSVGNHNTTLLLWLYTSR